MITLEEFRESLDGEFNTVIASHGFGTRLTMRTKIVDGEAKYSEFIVEHQGRIIYSGQFSTASRRYWEIAYNS